MELITSLSEDSIIVLRLTFKP